MSPSLCFPSHDVIARMSHSIHPNGQAAATRAMPAISCDPVSPRNVYLARHRTTSSDWTEMDRHQHRCGHVVYPVRGEVQCETRRDGIGRMWLIPPQSALWIPGGVSHAVWAKGEVDCFTVFLSPVLAATLPSACTVLSISPLLREIVMKAILIRDPYSPGSAAHRLMSVLVDEITASPTQDFFPLPLPRDSRLMKLARMLLAHPGASRTIHEWARDIALSSRSLSRLMQKELGMGFSQWRRQCQMMFALRRLNEGAPVQTIAIETGFESASAFIAMFKKCVGITPARYMDELTKGRTRQEATAHASATIRARQGARPA